MRHDWIFDVLRDLKTYALANGLPALAQEAEEALRVAKAEIAMAVGADVGDDMQSGSAPVRRTH